MPFRICKTFEIENGHMLSLHPDKCRFPHGHSRRVECVVEADDLDAGGMVCDFKAIKSAMGEVMDRYDHAMCVNTADPQFAALSTAYGERVIAFENEEPTTEVLARTFYEELSGRLQTSGPGDYAVRPLVRVVRVRVWETSTSWAEYE